MKMKCEHCGLMIRVTYNEKLFCSGCSRETNNPYHKRLSGLDKRIFGEKNKLNKTQVDCMTCENYNESGNNACNTCKFHPALEDCYISKVKNEAE